MVKIPTNDNNCEKFFLETMATSCIAGWQQCASKRCYTDFVVHSDDDAMPRRNKAHSDKFPLVDCALRSSQHNLCSVSVLAQALTTK